MAAHEAGRVREGHRIFLGKVAVLLGVADERVQVVADHFRHAGGAHRDHVGLVDALAFSSPANMFFWPPKTAASSVIESDTQEIGSLKCRLK